MRRVFALILVAALLCTALVGCGGREKTDLHNATSLADLKGATLGAQTGTFHLEALDQVDGITKKDFADFTDLLNALKSGAIDGYVAEEPTALEVLALLIDMQPEHKGQWSVGALALLICVMTAASILYADELFRWGLSFRVRDPEAAEPSDWELASRYFTWIALPMIALAMFIMGLQ